MERIFDRDGFDQYGRDKDGYNRQGFHFGGIHKITGTKYDPEGYNAEGYDSRDFDRNGINKYTGEKYNRQGRDKDGYDQEGYDTRSFDRNGINKYTGEKYNRQGIDKDGYDEEGYDGKGFDRNGIHKMTGTIYDPRGYDREGYNSEGFDRNNYNREGVRRWDIGRYDERGFDENGYHEKTGTLYDPKGFAKDGFNKQGLDREGYGRDGYNSQGYDKRGADKYGYTARGLHIEGYDENGYDVNGYDRNGNDRNGINRITGQVDKRIQLAKKIVEEDLTIEQFSKKYSLPMEQVKSAINAIRETPCIKQQLDEVLAKHSNEYMGALRLTANEILAGRIKITEVKNVSTIIGICSERDREKLTSMLMSAITSHEIGIMQYARMFGEGVEYTRLPKHMVEVLSEMKKTAGPRAREIYKEIDRVKAYQQPYRSIDGERMGYLAKPTDKTPTMVDITDTERDLARDYLKASGEYICNKTMQATLMKVIKGEIDEAKIERIRKETTLRELQQQDKELDIQLEQTGQVVGSE